MILHQGGDATFWKLCQSFICLCYYLHQPNVDQDFFAVREVEEHRTWCVYLYGMVPRNVKRELVAIFWKNGNYDDGSFFSLLLLLLVYFYKKNYPGILYFFPHYERVCCVLLFLVCSICWLDFGFIFCSTDRQPYPFSSLLQYHTLTLLHAVYNNLATWQSGEGAGWRLCNFIFFGEFDIFLVCFVSCFHKLLSA